MTDVATLNGHLAGPLTDSEQATLAEHEQVIEKGLKTFIEVGTALAAIREGRLYRTTHQTFETYCRERWNFNRHRASQLISAVDVVTNVTSVGLPAPANEGQARELAKVPAEDRADVWADTLDRTNDKPTAAAVRESAEVIEQRRKQAAEQRDARALLRRILDLLVPENASYDFVADWAKRLGGYDDELSGLCRRAQVGMSALDDLIERCGQ